jgi:hypothetical protein
VAASRTFTVIHDTCRSRAEKSEILRAFDVARRNLRVCRAGKDLASNCGVCGRCILQMLAMTAAGVEDLGAFKAALSPAAVRGVNLNSKAFLWQWRRIIEYATRHGRADHELFEAMRQRAAECERLAVDGGSRGPALRRGWFHQWKPRGDGHPA